MIYHAEVFMPRRVKGMVPTGVKVLTYSNHARQEFKDKNGEIKPPASLDFGKATVVEVTVFGQVIDKMVLRSQYDDTADLVFVVIPTADKQKWFVKTVWLNKKDDNHRTLDTNRFPVKKGQVKR